MAKNVLVRRHDKQYFVFEPQSLLYEDHALSLLGNLRTDTRKEDELNQTFLVFPETSESTDTFRIFNRGTGRVWTKMADAVGEQDLKVGDPSQVFNIRQVSPDQGSEFEILKSEGFVYICLPKNGDLVFARPVGDTEFVSRCDSFLLSSGGSFTALEISNQGNLQKLPPKLTEHKAPSPTKKPYATRVLRVPFFTVEDNAYDTAWKVQNSPWYYLRRQLTFFTKDEWFFFNETPVPEKVSWTTTQGFSETDSHSFSITAGLKLTTKTSFFGQEVAVEVSLGLGYTSTSTLTETYTEAMTREITAAPLGSTVMWQPQSTITLLRSDGTQVNKWVRNEARTYYRFKPIKDNKTKLFVMKSNEERARILTDDGEIGDFATVATLKVPKPK